jgi:hypothetical protein
MIRQQIVNELTNRFSQISVANGYDTDVKTVKEWHHGNFDDSDLPAIVIRDKSSQDIQLTNTEHQHLLKIEIDVLVKSNTAPSDIRKLLEDVYKAISLDDTWGGLAEYTKPLGNEMIVQYQDKTISGIGIDIEISYITKAWEI